MHPDPDCLEPALRRRAFVRALRLRGPVDAAALRSRLLGAVRPDGSPRDATQQDQQDQHGTTQDRTQQHGAAGDRPDGDARQGKRVETPMAAR